jgi:chromosome segregation ATPase
MSDKKFSDLKYLFICLLILLGTLLTAAPSFTDMPSSHWAYESVMFLAERGIISGLPDGSFSGSDPMTRYQSSVAMKRLVDYLQGSVSTGSSQVSDDRIHELEGLMENTLRAVEAAGRDYREIKQHLEGYNAEGQTTGSTAVSYDYELQKLEADMTSLNKKADRNSGSITETKIEIESLRSEVEANRYESVSERQVVEKRFEEMGSRLNVLRWTAIGGVIVGIAGIVMASFAIGK